MRGEEPSAVKMMRRWDCREVIRLKHRRCRLEEVMKKKPKGKKMKENKRKSCEEEAGEEEVTKRKR